MHDTSHSLKPLIIWSSDNGHKSSPPPSSTLSALHAGSPVTRGNDRGLRNTSEVVDKLPRGCSWCMYTFLVLYANNKVTAKPIKMTPQGYSYQQLQLYRQTFALDLSNISSIPSTNASNLARGREGRSARNVSEESRAGRMGGHPHLM